jgi:ribosomal protein S27AE
MKMRGMKHCPKCGSTDISFLVFYRPSTWKCLDCGYEGAFIVEDGRLPEEIQERHLSRCNSIDWMEREPHIDGLDSSTDAWEKLLENHLESGFTDEDCNIGLES